MQNPEELKKKNNLGEERVAVDLKCSLRDGSVPQPGDGVPDAVAANNNGQVLLVLHNTFTGEEVPRGRQRSHPACASRELLILCKLQCLQCRVSHLLTRAVYGY